MLRRHWQDGHTDVACLPSAFLLGWWDSLDTMRSSFLREGFPRSRSIESGRNLAVFGVEEFNLELLGISPFGVGGEKIVDKQFAVLATSASMNFEVDLGGAKDRRESTVG